MSKKQVKERKQPVVHIRFYDEARSLQLCEWAHNRGMADPALRRPMDLTDYVFRACQFYEEQHPLEEQPDDK